MLLLTCAWTIAGAHLQSPFSRLPCNLLEDSTLRSLPVKLPLSLLLLAQSFSLLSSQISFISSSFSRSLVEFLSDFFFLLRLPLWTTVVSLFLEHRIHEQRGFLNDKLVYRHRLMRANRVRIHEPRTFLNTALVHPERSTNREITVASSFFIVFFAVLHEPVSVCVFNQEDMFAEQEFQSSSERIRWAFCLKNETNRLVKSLFCSRLPRSHRPSLNSTLTTDCRAASGHSQAPAPPARLAPWLPCQASLSSPPLRA